MCRDGHCLVSGNISGDNITPTFNTISQVFDNSWRIILVGMGVNPRERWPGTKILLLKGYNQEPKTIQRSCLLVGPSNKFKPFLIECKYGACIFAHTVIELLMKEDSVVLFEGAQLFYYL